MSESSEAERMQLLDRLDGSGSEREWSAVSALRDLPEFPELLLQKYRQSTRYKQRAACVYYSLPHGATNESALTLGLTATADRSRVVRYRAAMLLAIAQVACAVPVLEAMKVNYPVSAPDADAAIQAITVRNPDLFVDRDNSGKVHLRFQRVDG